MSSNQAPLINQAHTLAASLSDPAVLMARLAGADDLLPVPDSENSRRVVALPTIFELVGMGTS